MTNEKWQCKNTDSIGTKVWTMKMMECTAVNSTAVNSTAVNSTTHENPSSLVQYSMYQLASILSQPFCM